MSEYTTQASVQAEIAQPWLIEGLDDIGSGSLNTATLNQIIADRSNAIDAALAGIYSVPFLPPFPPKVTEMALMFTCEAVYRRRLATSGAKEENPYEKIANELRMQLKRIGNREENLDANIPAAYFPGTVNVIPMAFDMNLQ